MTSTIAYTLNIQTQSSHAHRIRPALPAVFIDNDTQRTIAINKIASNLTKKCHATKQHLHLVAKQCFLPLTPTIEPTSAPINIDIQAKLGIVFVHFTLNSH
jgi:hypothetical protein